MPAFAMPAFTMPAFTMTVDQDGVATILWAQPGRAMNVIDPDGIDVLEALVARVLEDPAIKGAVLASGKPSFAAGADLGWIMSLTAHDAAVSRADRIAKLLEEGGRLQALTRRIEAGTKAGRKLFAAAIEGTAVGGGFELCLACHHRVVANDPAIKLGLPEVKGGLLPAAGGIARVVRTMGAIDALPLLLEGRSLSPAAALQARLVDAVVPAPNVLAAARSWVLTAGAEQAIKPWDRKGFIPPGPDPRTGAGGPAWSAANARLRQKSRGNYPAMEAVQSAIYDGWLVPFDTALRIELRAFVKLLLGDNARAMIRTRFVRVQEANRLPARPPEIPRQRVQRLAVLGDTAAAVRLRHLAIARGIEIVGQDSLAEADLTLAAPSGNGDSAALDVMPANIGSERRAGLRIPADGATVVEIAFPSGVSPNMIAAVLDFTRQLCLTPVVVGGYLSHRLETAYTGEARAMLAEGFSPALVENAGRALGMTRTPSEVERDRGMPAHAADLPLADTPLSFHAQQAGIAECKDRLLAIQVLEAARCMSEGIVANPADGDLVAVLGSGFAPWTGGPFTYIETQGFAFGILCQRLATQYGDRFSLGAGVQMVS